MVAVIFRNLLRRKGRTLLTVLGISIGVAAIIALGALAEGLEAGYTSMLEGSKADLVLSQPDAMDISYSSVDESVEEGLTEMPEVARASGMLEGFVSAEGVPLLFVFGYPKDSFVMGRFQIIEGVRLGESPPGRVKGEPILLGSAASEMLGKGVGDGLRLADSVYRIVGVYETGDPFEDSGAVLDLKSAQAVLGKPRQVSLIYIQLKEPSLSGRLETRVARRWADLTLSTTDDYADKQLMGDFMRGYVWAIAGLAILIGGVGMMNAQLMAVVERTREIGVLRAVGWSSLRVLLMILGESILTGLLGGAAGVGLGRLALGALGGLAGILGAKPDAISSALLFQAFTTVVLLGVVGGLYPAWRASRLAPVEALRYEGGTSSRNVRRLPLGGMAVQGLWQRSGRTFLTLTAISLTVGTIMSLDGLMQSASTTMTEIFGADFEVVIRQADVADSSTSAIDERVVDRVSAFPEVARTSGMVFTAVTMPSPTMFFIIFGYAPSESGIRRFNVVEGGPLTGNHQVLLGRVMADALRKKVGDTLDLSGSRFRVVGIYETGVSWEEMGGVVTLRDGQTLVGRPHKVTILSVKLKDPSLAQGLVKRVNAQIPEVHAALAGEFVEQMPDMENSQGMLDGVSILAIAVGGVGILNTMLMSVLERTREIGVLRATGWKRRSVLEMIIREALLLALLGGLAGVIVAFGLTALLRQLPALGDAFAVEWSLPIFARAIIVSLLLGLAGGLYPAFRATRLQPVEALRYE